MVSVGVGVVDSVGNARFHCFHWTPPPTAGPPTAPSPLVSPPPSPFFFLVLPFWLHLLLLLLLIRIIRIIVVVRRWWWRWCWPLPPRQRLGFFSSLILLNLNRDLSMIARNYLPGSFAHRGGFGLGFRGGFGLGFHHHLRLTRLQPIYGARRHCHHPEPIHRLEYQRLGLWQLGLWECCARQRLGL